MSLLHSTFCIMLAQKVLGGTKSIAYSRDHKMGLILLDRELDSSWLPMGAQWEAELENDTKSW